MALEIRPARAADLEAIIALLQQLSLDDLREDPEALAAYRAAFATIESNENQILLVADDAGVVAATAHLIIIPNLSNVGRPYAIVENVVVDASQRGKGTGEALMRRVIDIARDAGCYKLSLTSNKRRTDAHRFYERLGFTVSHVAMRIDF